MVRLCPSARYWCMTTVVRVCACRSPRVVNLALSLAEALVKNCDTPLHREVATPKFMAQMARLGRTYREKAGRENLEVADKVRRLVGQSGRLGPALPCAEHDCRGPP